MKTQKLDDVFARITPQYFRPSLVQCLSRLQLARKPLGRRNNHRLSCGWAARIIRHRSGMRLKARSVARPRNHLGSRLNCLSRYRLSH